MSKKKLYMTGAIDEADIIGSLAQFTGAGIALQGLGWDVTDPFMACGIGYDNVYSAAVPGKRMAERLAALRTCEAICLLPGWLQSDGAAEELQEALKLKMEIIKW